ncbi:hypothetical protein [Azotobacter chroococcum]|uniref:hypothetical protein n=1 Tax=Azotobacter chroococcum TaxID=353 RepID=UPI0010AE81C1|nr:hypothetical protein [Azotobacter chroococcum]TKD39926.1 hypothetical protein FCG41_11880 [Azotobacter chroococcum]
MATPRYVYSPKPQCCLTQILGVLRSLNLLPANGRLPVGFPSPAGSVKNGLDGHTDVTVTRVTDYDGSSLLFALTGVAQSPDQGLTYWNREDVDAWLAAQ